MEAADAHGEARAAEQPLLAIQTRSPGRVARMIRSSIGSKALMAVTGLGLLLFTFGHMLGNLQVFLGPQALNAYAAKLRGLGPLLWLIRGGLFAIFVVHIGAAYKVWRSNQAARPDSYRFRASVQTTLAGRTMILGGLVVLAFIVYHILHFTLGVADPEVFRRTHPEGQPADVYSMVVLGFRQWQVSVAYIAAQIVLGLHISHGASSAFQTLGVTHPRWVWLRSGFGPTMATIIVAGNVAIPAAILLGIVQPASA